MTDGQLTGRKDICDYFGCSWGTAKKIVRAVKDSQVFTHTLTGKPVLTVSAFESRYGRPGSYPSVQALIDAIAGGNRGRGKR